MWIYSSCGIRFNHLLTISANNSKAEIEMKPTLRSIISSFRIRSIGTSRSELWKKGLHSRAGRRDLHSLDWEIASSHLLLANKFHINFLTNLVKLPSPSRTRSIKPVLLPFTKHTSILYAKQISTAFIFEVIPPVPIPLSRS